jgi:hypothetical protein
MTPGAKEVEGSKEGAESTVPSQGVKRRIQAAKR